MSFQGLDSIGENEVQVHESQEIKVEENIFDPPLGAATCHNRQSATLQPQHHRDIRTVLVKEETSLVLSEVLPAQGSRHIQWNVEPVNIENSSPSKGKATLLAHFKMHVWYFRKYNYLLLSVR